MFILWYCSLAYDLNLTMQNGDLVEIEEHIIGYRDRNVVEHTCLCQEL